MFEFEYLHEFETICEFKQGFQADVGRKFGVKSLGELPFNNLQQNLLTLSLSLPFSCLSLTAICHMRHPLKADLGKK
jgi:hypothetical protein